MRCRLSLNSHTKVRGSGCEMFSGQPQHLNLHFLGEAMLLATVR